MIECTVVNMDAPASNEVDAFDFTCVRWHICPAFAVHLLVLHFLAFIALPRVLFSLTSLK